MNVYSGEDKDKLKLILYEKFRDTCKDYKRVVTGEKLLYEALDGALKKWK